MFQNQTPKNFLISWHHTVLNLTHDDGLIKLCSLFVFHTLGTSITDIPHNMGYYPDLVIVQLKLPNNYISEAQGNLTPLFLSFSLQCTMHGQVTVYRIEWEMNSFDNLYIMELGLHSLATWFCSREL